MRINRLPFFRVGVEVGLDIKKLQITHTSSEADHLAYNYMHMLLTNLVFSRVLTSEMLVKYTETRADNVMPLTASPFTRR